MGMNYEWRVLGQQEVNNSLSSVPFEEIPVQTREELVVRTGEHEESVSTVFAEGEIPVLSADSESRNAYFQLTQGFQINSMSAHTRLWQTERPLFFGMEACTAGSCDQARGGVNSDGMSASNGDSVRGPECAPDTGTICYGSEAEPSLHEMIGPVGRLYDDGTYVRMYEELSRVVVGDFNEDGFNDVLAIISSPDRLRDGSGLLFLGGSALYPERPPLYFEEFSGE